MHYLLMIYDDENMAMSETENQAILAEYEAFTQSIVQSGHFKAADRLRPTSTATTVRVRDGKTFSTDGLDEAVGIAARIPSAKLGSIEVRPIWAMNA